MKKLVLSSLMTVLVSQAAGCIITSDGDDDPATITVQWSVKNIASNQLIPCPPNAPTATIYTQEVNPNTYAPIGARVFSDVGCNESSALILVDPGVYQVWVDITGFATSLSAYVDVIARDQTFATTILDDGGYFQFDWNLVDADTNAPLSCAQAGATGVGAISTLVANQNTFIDDKFTCEHQTGITGGLLNGTYTVSIDAFDAGGSISPDPVNLANKVIGSRNQITDLGVVNIPILP